MTNSGCTKKEEETSYTSSSDGIKSIIDNETEKVTNKLEKQIYNIATFKAERESRAVIEAKRLLDEKAEREEAERLAAEQAAREEAERIAAEQAAQEEAKNLKVEEGKMAQEKDTLETLLAEVSEEIKAVKQARDEDVKAFAPRYTANA